MDQNTIERIAEIEREIAVLPAGSCLLYTSDAADD